MTQEEIETGCSSNLLAGFNLAHETGHFLGLADTRAPQAADTLPSTVDKDHPYIGSSVHANCFIGSSEEECESNAPWSHLLGDGCGQEGIEDCSLADIDYGKEVTCYPGCLNGIQSYRSIRAGVMPYGTALPSGIYRQTEFGAWDEWFLQQSINADYQITPPSYETQVPLSRMGTVSARAGQYGSFQQKYASITGPPLGSRISLTPQSPFSKGKISLQAVSGDGKKVALRFENTFTVDNGSVLEIQGKKYQVFISKNAITLKRVETLPSRFQLKIPFKKLRTDAQKGAFVRNLQKVQHSLSS